MLNLVNVICLLLLVASTKANDQVTQRPYDSVRESLRLNMRSSINKVEETYQNATTILDLIVSQIELEFPYHSGCRISKGKETYPSEDECISAECLELFNELMVTHKEKTMECSKERLKKVKAQHNRLTKIFSLLRNRLKRQKERSKSCLSLTLYIFRNKVRKCAKEIEEKLVDIVSTAELKAERVVKGTQTAHNLWGSDVSYCVALADDSSAMIKWHNVCKASKLSDD